MLRKLKFVRLLRKEGILSLGIFLRLRVQKFMVTRRRMRKVMMMKKRERKRIRLRIIIIC